MYEIGQNVVAITDKEKMDIWGRPGFKKGQIFTVRGIWPDFKFDCGHQLAIYLEELIADRNAPFARYYDYEVPYGAVNFRPLIKIDDKKIEALLNQER